MSTFRAQLIAARKAKGYTQEKLAELMNVSRPTISHWENGRALPDLELLGQLSQVLEYDFHLTPGTKEAAETAEKPAEKRNTAKKTAPKKAAPKKTAPRKKKPAGDTPAGYIRELVADAGAEGIMLSTITDAVRAKFKDFKVRDLGYSQMRQYMASVGDYDLEKSGRNFRVRLAK